MDRNCALLTGGNRVNGEFGASVNISAHKEIRLCRLIGNRVGHSALAAAQLYLRAL